MAVFEVFVKTDDGSELFKEFSDFKAFAKLQRTKSLEFASAVNEAKSLIDQLQGDIDKRKASRLEFLRSSAKASSKDEIVDEEEFRLTRELKEAKRSYRNSFEQMQKFKKESLDAQARSDQLKIELGRAFNRWSSGESKDTDAKASSSPVNKFDELDDQEAFDKMAAFGVSGFPVVDDNGRLLGIVTKRDLRAAEASTPIQEVMTKDPVTGRVDGSIVEVVEGRAVSVDLSLRALTEAQRQSLFAAEAAALPAPPKVEPKKKPTSTEPAELPPWADDNSVDVPDDEGGLVPVPLPVSSPATR